MRIRQACAPLLVVLIAILGGAGCKESTTPTTLVVTGPTAFEPAPAPYTDAVRVELDPEITTIAVGQSVTINATVTGGDSRLDRTLDWSSAVESGAGQPALIVTGGNTAVVNGSAPGIVSVTARLAVGDARGRATVVIVAATAAPPSSPVPPAPVLPPPPTAPPTSPGTVRGELVIEDATRRTAQLMLSGGNVDFVLRDVEMVQFMEDNCGVPGWLKRLNASLQLTGTGPYDPEGVVTGNGAYTFRRDDADIRAELAIMADDTSVAVMQAFRNMVNGKLCAMYEVRVDRARIGR